jgi:peptide chain release factor 2
MQERAAYADRMNAPEFWNDAKAAQKVIQESKVVRAQVEPLEDAIRLLEDSKVGYELAKEAGDRDMLAEVDETLFGLQAKMDKIEQQSLLSGKHDHRNCFVAIQAGAGGTEAEDWAGMLERMYLYYFQEMGWKIEEISRSLGPEAGVSEVSFRVIGPFSYGYMNCERGTHRLARVSPFNAEGKRQTSFATVDVTPEFEHTDLVIPAYDLEIVAFVRAAGPGGR